MDRVQLFEVIILIAVAVGLLTALIISDVRKRKYKELMAEIMQSLGLSDWKYLDKDGSVQLKSVKAVENYLPIQFFKDDRQRVSEVDAVLRAKAKYAEMMNSFLKSNSFMEHPMYEKAAEELKSKLQNLDTYNLSVWYISPAGRSGRRRMISYDRQFIDGISSNPSLLMSKSEYNQYVKAQNKELLERKQHSVYTRINKLIDLANEYRDKLVIDGDKDELDRLIASLFDRTVNNVKKVKTVDSEEWEVIDKFVNGIETDMEKILQNNQQILDYYDSSEFKKIKETCKELMDSQKDFNEYINEKAQSISNLFGSRIVRNETIVDDEYNYIRPYKKTITPFTAEVSASVFSSAENNPIEYVAKHFYPNKAQYPEQIQKLQLLIEELETLKDAKQIIDNYKKDYQQYITGVPSYVMENDEDGFYSRLGFANISESVLTIEYMFTYTSSGGMAKRYFTVPMTEETIIELINVLESKLTMASFAKEQRNLMTSKLRQEIKERDEYTCKLCGNSISKEPNLLLEIDHILPVSKGGYTIADNLQTLCWKCNRSKGSKLI